MDQKPGPGQAGKGDRGPNKALILLLARAEHERVQTELIKKGYVLGLKHDEKNKRTPWLAPWKDLTVGAKADYMKQAGKIPWIVKRAGFKLVPDVSMDQKEE